MKASRVVLPGGVFANEVDDDDDVVINDQVSSLFAEINTMVSSSAAVLGLEVFFFCFSFRLHLHFFKILKFFSFFFDLSCFCFCISMVG